MKIISYLGIFALALGVAAPCAIADPETRISPFSGKPVPRFESLRYATVNGRSGPSLEYPIAWRYERAGLPVMIVKESPQWRRVRDPEGAEVWVHARMLSAALTGIILQDATLKETALPESGDVAILQAGLVVELLDAGGNFVKIRQAGLTGWVRQEEVWGHLPP